MPPQEIDVDAIIVGAGPAGLSAAIWCNDVGLTACILESSAGPGGQLNRVYSPISNYPGLALSEPGQLRDTMFAQASAGQARFELGTRIMDVDATGRRLTLADGRRFNGRSAIYATGVRRRELGVNGEHEFAGRGVLVSGARQAEEVAGSSVAVVGGGDAALENALIFAGHGCSVTLIHRGEEFSARPDFIDSVQKHKGIKVLLRSTVLELTGGDRLSGLRVDSAGASTTLSVDNILIRIGVQPNSDLLAGRVRLDNRGYAAVDAYGRTSLQGVYAVGDLANPMAPTLATAAGMAATAVKHIEKLLR